MDVGGGLPLLAVRGQRPSEPKDSLVKLEGNLRERLSVVIDGPCALIRCFSALTLLPGLRLCYVLALRVSR